MITIADAFATCNKLWIRPMRWRHRRPRAVQWVRQCIMCYSATVLITASICSYRPTILVNQCSGAVQLVQQNTRRSQKLLKTVQLCRPPPPPQRSADFAAAFQDLPSRARNQVQWLWLARQGGWFRWSWCGLFWILDALELKRRTFSCLFFKWAAWWAT